MQKSPQEALSYFSRIYFPEFRDASRDSPSYFCSIFHCLKALERAMGLGWYNPDSFDADRYDFYSNRSHGDINWIIPEKIAAFSDPTGLNFEKLAENLKDLGIKTIIRLNHRTYSADKFRKLGFKHYDLFFHDGACPSEDLLRKFLFICENEHGAIAVHCKSGLGRAGTLIACYAMKHFEFPAAEVIAWVRINRPGSILGPQQVFLIEAEDTCFKWGEAHKKSLSGSSIFGGRNLEDKIPLRRKSFDMKNRLNLKQEKEKGLDSFLLRAKARTDSLERKSIEDRDAISPPVSYRKKREDFKRTFMNLSSCFFYKENVSITLASSCNNRNKRNDSL
jgi:protein-tyrosine phosphatase